jgi:signal transduction histidine kinase
VPSNPQTVPATRPWFLRSKFRLLGTLFLILAIPTAILTFLIAFYVRSELKQNAIQQSQLTARLVATSVDEEFYSLRKFVEDFSRRTKVLEYASVTNIAPLRHKLAEMVALNAKISRAFVVDAEGNFIADYPFSEELAGRNFRDRDWFKGASGQATAYVSEIYQRVNLDRAAVVTIAVRIEDPARNVLGYLGGQVTVDRLAQWLNKISPDNDRGVLLFDQAGQAVFSQGSEQLKAMQSAFNANEFGPAGEGWKIEQTPDGPKLGAYVRAPSIGWTIIAVQSTNTLFAAVGTVLNTVLVYFLLCLGGMAMLGLYWFKLLTAYDHQRQLTEEQLQAQAARLKQSNEELEALTYSIAHDLRGPLRAIRGLAIALREDYSTSLDSVGQDYVQRLDCSAQRMDDLTKDILDYGRLSHIDMPLQPVAIGAIIEKSLPLFADDIQAKGARLEVKSPLPQVLANPVIFEQILNNLISNALKFTQPKVAPLISVSAEEMGSRVIVRVKDNGIGIDATHQERIFGIFERLHKYDAFPGTGIGLAIVRKGVERMGGKVGVESKVGEGSCFWIDLPRA